MRRGGKRERRKVRGETDRKMDGRTR